MCPGLDLGTLPSSRPPRSMKYLVVDAGPLIKGARLEVADAERYITVPEVLREIRDRQARSGLQLLPFDIDTKEPSDEAMARVAAFARKTGDYAALSQPDLKILALTWMLEKESNGAKHLLETPKPMHVHSPGPRGPPRVPPQRVPQPPSAPAGTQGGGGSRFNEGAGSERPALGEEDSPLSAEEAAEALRVALADEAESLSREITCPIISLNLVACSDRLVRVKLTAPHEDEHTDAAEAPAPPRDESTWSRLPGWARAACAFIPPVASDTPGPTLSGAALRPAPGGPRPEDDDLPWITTDNVRQAQRRDARFGHVPDDSTDVCCMTTDFAMQNVIMRMGMKLLSADGLVMKSVKQWGKQCSGCFRIAHDMEREFCGHCGNATLVRVAIVVDRQGRERVLPIPEHVKQRIMSTRGQRYTMPKPKQGRNAGNVITAEDQLAEARWKHIRNGGARKPSGDVFDPNYDFDAHFGRAGKQPKGKAGREPTVGMGRKNPNDVRSRPKKR
mmetsp:Transcript_23516/g.63731  ORF Transcript_23516/g.63731 Transcript_23516/m.63731 type:complete len:504 (+) Transcript_23516:21-1532(+)